MLRWLRACCGWPVDQAVSEGPRREGVVVVVRSQVSQIQDDGCGLRALFVGRGVDGKGVAALGLVGFGRSLRAFWARVQRRSVSMHWEVSSVIVEWAYWSSVRRVLRSWISWRISWWISWWISWGICWGRVC